VSSTPKSTRRWCCRGSKSLKRLLARTCEKEGRVVVSLCSQERDRSREERVKYLLRVEADWDRKSRDGDGTQVRRTWEQRPAERHDLLAYRTRRLEGTRRSSTEVSSSTPSCATAKRAEKTHPSTLLQTKASTSSDKTPILRLGSYGSCEATPSIPLHPR